MELTEENSDDCWPDADVEHLLPPLPPMSPKRLLAHWSPRDSRQLSPEQGIGAKAPERRPPSYRRAGGNGTARGSANLGGTAEGGPAVASTGHARPEGDAPSDGTTRDAEGALESSSTDLKSQLRRRDEGARPRGATGGGVRAASWGSCEGQKGPGIVPLSSRPTTAGQDTASALSCSWREDRLLSNGFVPSPQGWLVSMHGRVAPPVPPLPPPPASFATAPRERGLDLDPTAGESLAAALRRVSRNPSAKAFIPPPVAYRRRKTIDSDASSDTASCSAKLWPEDSQVPEKVEAAADDEDIIAEELRSQAAHFSELARAFAVLEVA